MRAILATSCLLASILMPSSSWAAVPDWQRISVHAQKVQPAPHHVMAIYEETTLGSRSPMAIRVLVSAAGAVRLDTQDVHHGHTKSQVWNLSLDTSTTSGKAKPIPGPPAWLCWLAGYPVSQIMADKEVATARVSLSHLGATILWVVGAGPQEPDLPQLHFERETGRLRRSVEDVLFPDEGKKTWVRLEPSPDPSQRGWPKTIVLGNGELKRVLVNTLLRFDHPAAATEFESPTKPEAPVSDPIPSSSPPTSSP